MRNFALMTVLMAQAVLAYDPRYMGPNPGAYTSNPWPTTYPQGQYPTSSNLIPPSFPFTPNNTNNVRDYYYIIILSLLLEIDLISNILSRLTSCLNVTLLFYDY
jgi:hypothetical protein